MKRIRKLLTIFAVLVFSMGALVSCSNPPIDNRSTPDAAMENYMETVKAGEIEKSHRFMDRAFLEINTLYKTGGININDEWEKELKELDAYKEYQRELKKKYKQLEYKITDVEEKEDINQKKFTIDLIMPDLNKVNDEVISEIVERHLIEILTSDDEDGMYDGFSQMYEESTQALKDANEMVEMVSENITFAKSCVKEKDCIEDDEGEWVIAEMSVELFDRLADDKELWLRMPDFSEADQVDVITVPGIDFSTTELESGEAFDPADYEGKNIIITFTNSRCPYCDEQSLAYEELRDDLDFEMFYIPTKETNLATSNTLDALEISDYELIIDRGNSLFDALDIKTVPTSLIKSKEGNNFKMITGVVRGDSEDNEKVLSNYID